MNNSTVQYGPEIQNTILMLIKAAQITQVQNNYRTGLDPKFEPQNLPKMMDRIETLIHELVYDDHDEYRSGELRRLLRAAPFDNKMIVNREKCIGHIMVRIYQLSRTHRTGKMMELHHLENARILINYVNDMAISIIGMIRQCFGQLS